MALCIPAGYRPSLVPETMEQAIKDSGLTPEQISNPRTGLIAGSGGASTLNQMEAIDTLREKGVKRIGPYRVTRTMGSTVRDKNSCCCCSCEA